MLRAVNVAGTGKLPMSELAAIGRACGFDDVSTFIASGNLLFSSDRDEPSVARALAERIESYFGKPVPLFVRSGAEMAEVVARNPFTDDQPSRVMAHFIAEPPGEKMLAEARGVAGERMAIGPRMIYVSYGDGIGKTRLKLPAVDRGTARNMNSVARIAGLLA